MRLGLGRENGLESVTFDTSTFDTSAWRCLPIEYRKVGSSLCIEAGVYWLRWRYTGLQALIDATTDAVCKWKFEAAPDKGAEIVQVMLDLQ
ncbi:MAG: hypothetical protein WB683_12405 [Candidatus Sulfotelmatobacter sp.]